MTQSEINPGLAVIVIVALWGLAGWLDQPMQSPAAVATGNEHLQTSGSALRSCVAWEAHDGPRGFGPSPVAYTIGPGGTDVFDADTSAARHRCPAHN